MPLKLAKLVNDVKKLQFEGTKWQLLIIKTLVFWPKRDQILDNQRKRNETLILKGKTWFRPHHASCWKACRVTTIGRNNGFDGHCRGHCRSNQLD